MSFNILLAEDDEDIVKLLKLYLENEGFSTNKKSTLRSSIS